jgi:hypothetical protein
VHRRCLCCHEHENYLAVVANVLIGVDGNGTFINGIDAMPAVGGAVDILQMLSQMLLFVFTCSMLPSC